MYCYQLSEWRLHQLSSDPSPRSILLITHTTIVTQSSLPSPNSTPSHPLTHHPPLCPPQLLSPSPSEPFLPLALDSDAFLAAAAQRPNALASALSGDTARNGQNAGDYDRNITGPGFAYPVTFEVQTGDEPGQSVSDNLDVLLYSDRYPDGVGWRQLFAGNCTGRWPDENGRLFRPGQTDAFQTEAAGEMGVLTKMHVLMRGVHEVRWGVGMAIYDWLL